MKKIKIIISFLLVLILTGCVKYNTEMKINDDKSVELTMRYSMQTNEESKNSSVNVNTEDFNFLKNYGYTIEEYTDQLDDGKISTGIIISKKFNSLDDITSDEKFILDITKSFQEEDKNYKYDKFFYKEDSRYIAKYLFNFVPTDDEGNSINLMDYSAHSDMFDLKFSLSLPKSVKYVESNATEKSIDNKTLTWNLEVGKSNEVSFSFSYDRYINKIDKILILSSLGVIAVSILFIIILSIINKKDKKKIEVDESNDLEKESNE